jgi:hypothetical protein
VNITAAAQESPAPQSKNLRTFASQSDPSRTLSVSALIFNPRLGVSVEAT